MVRVWVRLVRAWPRFEGQAAGRRKGLSRTWRAAGRKMVRGARAES